MYESVTIIIIVCMIVLQYYCTTPGLLYETLHSHLDMTCSLLLANDTEMKMKCIIVPVRVPSVS